MRIEEELMRTDAYPEETGGVELLQTHISFVFLTDNYVYKVKKPVNFGFLDFSTLEKRKHYCEKEIELNKRLSSDVYLEVVPVVDSGERLVLAGEGDIVDYAVKMKRIPMDRLMKTLLSNGELTEDMVGEVGKKIAGFHEIAENSPEIDRFGDIETVEFNTDENFQQTEKYIGQSITKERFDFIKSYTDEFYDGKRDVIEGRVKQKRIKDCHGDLHMEHICLTKPIIIFDCIEFNDRFRYSDTAADIAFLAMDLDYNGRQDFSKVLMDAYVEYSGDKGVWDMLNFYKIYRAYVRGKVISFRLDDPAISEEDKEEALNLASRYFELAESYVREEAGND